MKRVHSYSVEASMHEKIKQYSLKQKKSIMAIVQEAVEYYSQKHFGLRLSQKNLEPK